MLNFGELIRVSTNDLDEILEWRNSEPVRKNMYRQAIISRDEHYSWWDSVRQKDDCRYFIFRSSGKKLGVVSFSSICLEHRNSCWAFYASPDAPRGTGSRMEFLALDYAFSELNLLKLYCEVLSYNESVIKLHKKFGFLEEGLFKRQFIHEGRFVDIFRLAIFCDRWLEKREEVLERMRRY